MEKIFPGDKYKIVISIIFGVIGFIGNFYAIEFVNLSDIGIRVHFLWGLMFPLIITIAWGWRYGLISALAGGCQTMWWLWWSDGYGIFYSVPLSTLWVVWHGFWGKIDRSHQSWFTGKYFMELIFRVIDFAGGYFIFRFLISYNPPPWAPEAGTTDVSAEWLISAILARAFSGFLLLIMADTVIRMPNFKKFFRIKSDLSSEFSFIYYIFVLLGVLFWVIDAVLDYFFFFDNNFFNLLLFKIPPHEVFVRLVILLVLLIAGRIISRILADRTVTDRKYRNLFNNIDDAIILFALTDGERPDAVCEVNQRTQTILRYSREQLFTLSYEDILGEKGINLNDLQKTQPQKFETKLITKCKQEIPVEVKIKKFLLDNEYRLMVIARDISERKEYEQQLKEQKEELQTSNEQLTAFTEEIIAMNKELDRSLKRVNQINRRFNEMVNIVSSLGESSYQSQKAFLKELLGVAIRLVPEADYGKVYLFQDGWCRIVATMGHNLELLSDLKINRNHLRINQKQEIVTSADYCIDLSKLPESQIRAVNKALQPIQKSIFVNITLESRIIGVLVLDIASGSKQDFAEETITLLKSFATLASAFFSFQRYADLRERFTRELIYSFTNILDMYDKYTSGHSHNVARLAVELARELGLTIEEINDAYWAGMVHDIGKLLLPLDIINKQGSLTDPEYETVKKHPVWGYSALSDSVTLTGIADYVLYHHERWDGRGYPEGLKGEQIPRISRILAVADAWDAMRSRRAYREPFSRERAIREIKKNMGTQFAPEAARALLALKVSGEGS